MTLKEFGYKFNSKGRLRTIENDNYFQYYVSDDEYYNQSRYEATGKALTKEIYNRLEVDCRLKRMNVSIGNRE